MPTDNNEDEATADTKPAAADTADTKRTPNQWATRTGHFGPKTKHVHRAGYSAEHRAAEILHGWIEHEHHAAAPIELTRAEYQDALKAIDTSPAKPHDAALSKHCNHNFRKA